MKNRVDVFISSTQSDLADYRAAVRDVVLSFEYLPIMMEYWPAMDVHAVEVCRQKVEGVDAFIGLLAHRYGHCPQGFDVSITEIEFDRAQECNIPRLCFVIDESTPWKKEFIEDDPGKSKLEALKKRLDATVIRGKFTTVENLQLQVYKALLGLQKHTPAKRALGKYLVIHIARPAVGAGEDALLHLALEGSRDSFSESEFLDFVSHLIKIPADQIQIKGKDEGSILLQLAMPWEAAEKLYSVVTAPQEEKQPAVIPEPQPEESTPYLSVDDPALLYAWRHVIAFDDVSKKQKNRHIFYRRMIIILIFCTSTLAAVATFPIVTELSGDDPAKRILHVLLVIFPLITAALMSYASQFAPSLAWVVFRVGAERVKRAIYLYRMQTGNFDGKRKKTTTKQRELCSAVDDARSEIDKLDTLVPFLPTYDENTDHVLATIRKAWLTDDEADNGFEPLTGEEYRLWRVVPQRNWYIDRIRKDYRALRWGRVALLVSTILASVFAAGNVAQMVVVTTALGVAVTTFLQLKMYGQIFPNYHQTATKIDFLLSWWQILSPAEKQLDSNLDRFVLEVEDTFQAERDRWMEQAIQAQTAGEQTLMKNIQEWTNRDNNNGDWSGAGDTKDANGTSKTTAPYREEESNAETTPPASRRTRQ